MAWHFGLYCESAGDPCELANTVQVTQIKILMDIYDFNK
jgi:hypothetical protein